MISCTLQFVSVNIPTRSYFSFRGNAIVSLITLICFLSLLISRFKTGLVSFIHNPKIAKELSKKTAWRRKVLVLSKESLHAASRPNRYLLLKHLHYLCQLEASINIKYELNYSQNSFIRSAVTSLEWLIFFLWTDTKLNAGYFLRSTSIMFIVKQEPSGQTMKRPTWSVRHKTSRSEQAARANSSQ